MDIDEARSFLRQHHRSVLHTARSDGSPQLSPVFHGIDGDGKVVISTRETAMKAKNLRRRPAAALCALADEFVGQWVQVNGSAEIVALPEAMDGLKDAYRQIAGEHPNWAEFEEAMARERRVLLRITIETVGPTRSG